MKIQAHLYHLQPRHPSLPKRAGALLRFEFSSFAKPGFADCHPWPELGDAALPDQLAGLAEGKLTPLTSRALALAEVDAHARSESRWLLAGLEIPRSHFTVVGPLGAELMGTLESLRAQGFRELKLKVGRDLAFEAEILRATRPEILALGLKVRLDFNEKPDVRELSRFLDLVGCNRDWVDWLEDPLLFEPGAWAKLKSDFGIPLAIDRPLARGVGSAPQELEAFQVLIAKPALENPAPIARLAATHDKAFAVTSYLDHPLGQACAAWSAATLGAVATGLVTHLTYEENSFSQILRVRDARLSLPEGTGFGFDHELAQLSWVNLRPEA